KLADPGGQEITKHCRALENSPCVIAGATTRLEAIAAVAHNLAADGGGLVVALNSSAAIEDLRIALGDSLVQSKKLGCQLMRRPRFQLEMMKTIFAPHQCRTVLAHGLANAGRNVADRKADASVGRRIGRRAVHQTHMVERHLAGAQGQSYRLCRIDLDRDLLPAGA